jgi:tetratricopeptide (TPR) repeat protein
MTALAEAASALADAAFGADPGRWPLPGASTPHERWLRAVAAGGQGRYACALTELSEILRCRDSGSVVSLAHSTRASFLRQLGGHARARAADGQAWAHCAGDPEAAADALVGLAADALGMGRFGVSARLLERARTIDTPDNSRRRIRLSWVSAELAMVQGHGAEAVEHARRAVAAAAGHSSTRHAVKSDVVLAAALCSAGEYDAARDVADSALQAAEKSGLIPLRWALACVLADIGSAAHDADQISRIRDLSADTVRRRGGVWAGA